MKSMKPNNFFAPYEKQGQCSEIFLGFFLIGKGETRDTGDTRDTRAHKGLRGDRGTQGDTGQKGQI